MQTGTVEVIVLFTTLHCHYIAKTHLLTNCNYVKQFSTFTLTTEGIDTLLYTELMLSSCRNLLKPSKLLHALATGEPSVLICSIH